MQSREYQLFNTRLSPFRPIFRSALFTHDSPLLSIKQSGLHLKLGTQMPNNGLDNEELQLRLDMDNSFYFSCGQHGWFEDEILEIQEALPHKSYMKCCFNCAYSDYSSHGGGLFGDLLISEVTKRNILV